MRIESAQIAATAKHQAVTKSVRQESLEMWVGERNPRQAAAGDHLSLSPKAAATQPVRKDLSLEDEETLKLSPRDQLIADILRRMIKALTGRDVTLLSPQELADKLGQGQTAEVPVPAQQTPSSTTESQPKPAGYGVAYDYYESHYEYEAVSYNAEGTIKTQDGKEIQFSVQLNMSREFYTEQRESLRLGDAKKIDPLVVNFAGTAAELGDTRFEFDLDSDGRSEQLAVLKPGSGLLALDKNADGQINDGKELFGPSSGNGFAELAAYDQDGNNFIDENDAVYNKLRIWSRDAEGNQQLVGLGQAGIGAIYLGSLATPFTYKDGEQNTLGQAVSTGVFLRENGGAGTIQQIDYAA